MIDFETIPLNPLEWFRANREPLNTIGDLRDVEHNLHIPNNSPNYKATLLSRIYKIACQLEETPLVIEARIVLRINSAIEAPILLNSPKKERILAAQNLIEELRDTATDTTLDNTERQIAAKRIGWIRLHAMNDVVVISARDASSVLIKGSV